MIFKNYFVILLSGLFFMSANLYAVDDFFQSSMGDYQEELEIAVEEDKKAVMVFFEMDECPFCHWMKTNVLNKPEVQAYFKKHFILLAHDIEGDVEITDFSGDSITQKDFASKKHRVRATPVIAFFGLKGKKKGKRIARFTGRTSSVEEFMLLGKYVETGAYQKMKFSKYKRLKR